jgi:hypothetical protein
MPRAIGHPTPRARSAGGLCRRSFAILLSILLPASLAWPQQASIAPVPASKPALFRPYFAVGVPPVRLSNTSRLGDLVRAGTLYLTVQDAIALALENNIDIEVARYNPVILSWNLTRSEAGGALPGVPSNASQAGTVASGQGVAGSQQAAGVSIPGSTSGRTHHHRRAQFAIERHPRAGLHHARPLRQHPARPAYRWQLHPELQRSLPQ